MVPNDPSSTTPSTTSSATPSSGEVLDVVVVGGGIVGCAIARELSRFDLVTELWEAEADVGFGTSKANSGIIHGGHHSPDDTLKGTLEWAGNRAWPRLAEELDIGFRVVGDLTIAFDDDEDRFLGRLARRAAARGVHDVERWDADRLRRCEPNVNPEAIGALAGNTTAVVNPYEACFALAENAAANGVEVRLDCPVVDIGLAGGVFTVSSTTRAARTRHVVNAAGHGAAKIADLVGAKTFELSGRKGEEYLLDKRLDGLVERILFPCPTPTSKGTLVIPTFDGTIMVGPTADPTDDPFDLDTTSAGADAVFAAAKRLVPGLSSRDCIAEFAGVRAVASTGDFVIERSPVAGFINVAGIQSPGLTAAPAIASMVIDLLADDGLALVEKRVFVERVPEHPRVASSDLDRRRRLAEADGGFGHVICRCELVTEAEVVDAIRRGATTLDGVKFRTRAGMGRCQGGFCTWPVMSLIGRELGVAVSSVTKRGAGSWIACEREAVS